jgi:hypothetical protein
LWIVTESEATGLLLAELAGAGEGIPLMPAGIAVGSGDGVPAVPAKPASLCPLAGLIAAPAELPPLPPHAASSMVPTAAPAMAAAHQRRFQRR